MYRFATKKILTFMLSILMILSVWIGAFPYVNQGYVAHAEAVDTYSSDEVSSEAPKNLEELQKASDEQLEHWAKELKQFDGRKYDYVTAAKRQVGGTCYAYAAVGAAEASILREGIDPELTKDTLNFDESYVIWAMLNRDGEEVDPLGNTLDDNRSAGTTQEGGKPEEIFSSMNQGYSLHQAGTISTGSYEMSKYRLENMLKVERNVEDIKAAVIKYGAVAFCFAMPPSLKNNRAKAESNWGSGHSCIIVGWDDTLDKNSFSYKTSAPTVDGGWIVKNSWGPSSGDGGFFYLSYESVIDGIYAADFAMNENYENVYYYDGGGWAWTTSVSKYNTFAAIYQAKKASATTVEKLDSVFVGVKEATECTIEIYTGLKTQAGNVNSSINDPTNGTLKHSQKVTFANTGEYTVQLTNSVELNVGEWFSVVVHLTNGAVMVANDYTSLNDMTYYRMDNGMWRNCKWSNTSEYADSGKDVARIRANTSTTDRDAQLDKNISNALVIIRNRFFYYLYGSQFRPEVEVYFGSDRLEEGKDYTLQYVNNVAPNTTDDVNNDAKVIVTGKGDYTGSKEETLFVAKVDLPPNKPYYKLNVYDDVKKARDIVLPDGWTWATFNTNGILDKELNVGDTVTLYIIYNGSGYYLRTSFELYVTKQTNLTEKTSIVGCEISLDEYEYVYSGVPITPPVTVTVNGVKLNYFSDYVVEYSGNVAAGTATVTVKGVGQYSGTVTETFYIAEAPVDSDVTPDPEPDPNPDPEPEHQHSLTLVAEKSSTCTEVGHKSYYICSGCDSWFDADDKTEMTDKSSVSLPLAEHNYTGVSWSSDAEGHWRACEVCGQITDRVVHDENGAEGACSFCGYKAAAPDPTDPEPDTEPDNGEVPDEGEEEPPVGDPDESEKPENPDDGDETDFEPQPDPNESDEPADEGDNMVAVAVGVTTGVVGAGALGGVAFWFIRRRRRL